MAWRSGLCATAAFAGWRLHDIRPSVATACFMVAYLFGGWDLARETWKDFRGFRFNTHFLMLMVVPATAALGAWGEGALLLVLFSASAALEQYAMSRTRSAIGALLRGAPKSAVVLTDDGGAREVPVDDVQTGMTVRVAPGQQVPVDIRVVAGGSACDESSLTGESIPVEKEPGDTAYAGTMNIWGALDGVVLRPAQESSLQKMVKLVEEAQKLRAPSQRLADAFGTRYTLFVLVACTILFLVTWLGGGRPVFFGSEDEFSAFYRAMTLLVVMSPCALVLSVPSAILSAIACGARNGVLFRGGAAIERFADVRTIAMDKTGTLTEGRLKVERVNAVRGTEEDVLKAAVAVAQLSTHPVSKAIAAEGVRRGLQVPAIAAPENVPGAGFRGTLNGEPVFLGSRKAVSALAGSGFPGTGPPPVDVNETWVWSPSAAGAIWSRDVLRAEAPELIARLHADGVKTVMLTGDRPEAAAVMAKASGVGEVDADLSPAGKVERIEELKRERGPVAMVGDGVNDAPCLAAADVAIAMGARGSDAAIEQADVVLMHDRLENVILARAISVRARRIIRENIIVSIGTMAGMAIAVILSSSVPLALGVAMHEGSTAVVVLNSLRLLILPVRFRKGRNPSTPES